MIYGVARVSTGKQHIERQIRNIKAAYPEAHIIKETYTGTKLEGRKEFEKLLNKVKVGDTLVFDSCSRMSRNEAEAMALYEDLFKKGVNLIFLKEGYINTDVYRKALENQLEINLETGNASTDELMSTIIGALNKYTMNLAKEQIRLAFAQAEKEVMDLRTRTQEGLVTARLNGKQIGQPKGSKLTTKKSIEAKEIILKHSQDFNGNLKDEEVMKLAGIARNSYYKYKKELKELNS